MPDTISSIVSPLRSLEVLSQHEVNRLRDTSKAGLHDLLRRCALAVLSSGSVTDDSLVLMETYHDFDIEVIQQDRGIRLKVTNAPAEAFVDGKMIRGIREHLSSVLRDIVYVYNEIQHHARFDLSTGEGTTNAVFHILRKAGTLKPGRDPGIVVCWGGHSITREEYDYTKDVGYHLGLRELDICTGCGPGAMKGPMKGANLAHAKQRVPDGRYLGISEPGIIAAEAPNPLVNELVVMPDIEKRLEAFIRIGHGIVVFPGGVGTAEEILYLLGILLHPDNADMEMPVIFTGPASAADYFKRIDEFLVYTLGESARAKYRIIVDDPVEVARTMREGIDAVTEFRRAHQDAFHFNWRLTIARNFQETFEPTHEAMAGLALHPKQPVHELAANLRRAFSGIVAGNVKERGLRAIEAHGPFSLHAEPELMRRLDELLGSFVAQGRMKLPGQEYVPCYRLV
ncbi:nucleotide 5'-monophosphate nucleosidase PpnN [Billgrantia saliphila]|uniref:nucleotide 5'-monophosphate nucleosidase PpnN n=1 Tax=Billgrantia saliphila TaxID=1848458 RepID=UPI000CE39D65|nr:nucleotide 5'-monophosphate nucleosidase PpnN [Halomonas saliphila]